MENVVLRGKNGHKICVHNQRKSDCVKCGGSSVCKHGRRKRICKECMGSGICNHKRQRYDCSLCSGIPRSHKKKRLAGESFEEALRRWENNQRWEPNMSRDKERILDAFDFEVSQCLKTFYTNRSLMASQSSVYVFKRDYTQLFDIIELSVRAKETFASPFQRIRSLATQIFSRFPQFMRHIFWQYLLGPEETSKLGLDHAKQPKTNRDGSIRKQPAYMRFTDKHLADVGILFKEGKEFQMVIPNYRMEVQSKEGPHYLNPSWYNSFLHGGPDAGDYVLWKIINNVEAKNNNSIAHVCESLSLQLPLSNKDPHSLVIRVQELSQAGKSLKNIGIIVLPSDANIDYLIHHCGVTFIEDFEQIWRENEGYCSADFAVKDCECSRRVFESFSLRCFRDFSSTELKRVMFCAEWDRYKDENVCPNDHAPDIFSSEVSGRLYDVFDGFKEMRFRGFKLKPTESSRDDRKDDNFVHIRGSFRKLCRTLRIHNVSCNGTALGEVECHTDNVAICDAIPSLEETLLLPMKDVPNDRQWDKNSFSRYQTKIRYNLLGVRHIFHLSVISRAERLSDSKYPVVKKNISKSVVNSQIWYSNYVLS